MIARATLPASVPVDGPIPHPRPRPGVGWTHAPAGALLNVVLRFGIVAMTVDALVNGGDQRDAG